MGIRRNDDRFRDAMRGRLIVASVVVLSIRLVWMYVIPAWNEITTDFQNYYTSAWAVRHDRPLMDLYDTSAFHRENERARVLGRTALFNYFTPFSALVMWPIAHLRPQQAMRAWTIVNLAALAATVILVARSLKAPVFNVLLVALLGGDALGNNFAFGQFYIVLSLLLAAAVIWLERRPAVAGLFLAIASVAKVFPGLFLALFAWQRRLRVIAWSAIGVLLLTALGIGVMGWSPHRVFIEEVLPRMARGEVQDPYSVQWNTLQALLRRALVAEPGLNPDPIADIPWLFFFLRVLVTLGVVIVTFAALRGRKFGLIEYGGVIAAISLITPSQASYHQALFFPAVAAAIHFHSDLRIKMAFALAYALICSNYMGAGTRFDSGPALLLAFPRVYLVIALWLAFIVAVSRKAGGHRPPLQLRVALVGALAAASLVAFFDWQRWQADVADGAVMARPEHRGSLEVHPTVGSGGLVFSSLRESYSPFHPSAFGSGLVYESNGVISGRLPDGTGIRWPGAMEPALGPQSVVALSPDGRAIVERTRHDSNWRELLRRETILHDPAISPDGNSIAFSEWVNGRYRISEWSRAEGRVQVLIEGRADYRYPAYSPKSSELAFSTNESGSWNVSRLSLSTGHRELLAHSSGNDFMPAYSPDGTRVYFASDRHRGYRFTAIYSIVIDAIASIM
jgi:hypothetical protein